MHGYLSSSLQPAMLHSSHCFSNQQVNCINSQEFFSTKLQKEKYVVPCCLGNLIPCEFRTSSALKICGVGDVKFIAHTLKIVFDW